MLLHLKVYLSHPSPIVKTFFGGPLSLTSKRAFKTHPSVPSNVYSGQRPLTLCGQKPNASLTCTRCPAAKGSADASGDSKWFVKIQVFSKAGWVYLVPSRMVEDLILGHFSLRMGVTTWICYMLSIPRPNDIDGWSGGLCTIFDTKLLSFLSFCICSLSA